MKILDILQNVKESEATNLETANTVVAAETTPALTAEPVTDSVTEPNVEEDSEHKELYGLRVGDVVNTRINGRKVQGNVIDIFPDDMQVELLLRGGSAGRTVTVDVRDTEAVSEDATEQNNIKEFKNMKVLDILKKLDEIKESEHTNEAKNIDHQHKIARDTVKNPNKSFLGGPSAKEAEETLRKKYGYNDKQIEKLKNEEVEQTDEASMTRKQKDAAVRKFFQHDPEAGEKILAFGKKEREEKKAFDSGKKEIERLKKQNESEQVEEAVNITVTGSDAVLSQILKLAGLIGAATTEATDEVAVEDHGDRPYASSPDEIVFDVDAAVPAGNDMHKSKETYPKVAGADNPMRPSKISDSK